MKKLANSILLLNILICIVAVATIASTMIFLDWRPCPMCLLQQFCILTILIFSILGLIKKKPISFLIVIKIVIIITIIGGIYIAADQVYIQYFFTFSTQASCDISNPLLIDATKSLTGAVESCNSISEQINGISLAAYSLSLFIFMFIVNIIALLINILKFKRSKVL